MLLDRALPSRLGSDTGWFAIGRLSRGACRWLLAGLFVTATALGPAHADPGVRNTEQFIVYFGILPAALAQSKVSAHAVEPGPHGALPLPVETHHLVVAVFDTRTGARLTDADVQARHAPLRGVATEKPLLPMALGEVLSYGNTFVIPEGPDHRFVLRIRQGTREARVEFTYDNLHGSAR